MGFFSIAIVNKFCYLYYNLIVTGATIRANMNTCSVLDGMGSFRTATLAGGERVRPVLG